MNVSENLSKALAYVEKHLKEPLDLAKAASETSYSPFYFEKLFEVFANRSYGSYFYERKLSEAGHFLLKNPSIQIVDIAFEFGYRTPESFSRAFSKFNGMSPIKARQSSHIRYIPPLHVSVCISGGDNLKCEIVMKSTFIVACLFRYFTEKDSHDGIPLFWKEYFAQGYEKKMDWKYGISFASYSSESFWYGIGSDFLSITPEHFTKKEIPGGQYACFSVVGPMPDAQQEAWKEIFASFFSSSSYQLGEGPALEVYSPGDCLSSSYRSEIWLPVKRALSL